MQRTKREEEDGAGDGDRSQQARVWACACWRRKENDEEGVRVAWVEKAGPAGPKGSKGPALVMGGPGSQRPGWALSPLSLFLENTF